MVWWWVVGMKIWTLTSPSSNYILLYIDHPSQNWRWNRFVANLTMLSGEDSQESTNPDIEFLLWIHHFLLLESTIFGESSFHSPQFLVKPLNFRQFFVGYNQALCLVAGTMSGAVRSVILQHFAKGGSLPPGAGVRCCFSIEIWIDFKVNKREIWYMYDICMIYVWYMILIYVWYMYRYLHPKRVY